MGTYVGIEGLGHVDVGIRRVYKVSETLVVVGGKIYLSDLTPKYLNIWLPLGQEHLVRGRRMPFTGLRACRANWRWHYCRWALLLSWV